MKQYIVDEKKVQSLLNYLLGRPAGEVLNGIKMLEELPVYATVSEEKEVTEDGNKE